MGVLVIVALFALPNVDGLGSTPGAAIAPAGGSAYVAPTHLTAAHAAPIPLGLGNPTLLSANVKAPLDTVANEPYLDSLRNASAAEAAAASPSSGAPATSGAPAAPAASAATYAVVFGYVLDARTGRPIAGATVDPQSNGGKCSLTNCTSDNTNSAGYWSIHMVPPSGEAAASAPGYLANSTYIYNITDGATLGPYYINLTKEGTISGRIEGNDPSHELVTCTVIVSTVSRDSLTLGLNLTVSSGIFNGIPVPPFPSVISFDPKCPEYEANQYWINVSAYGAENMGVVYLPVYDLIQASIYDSVTHRSVSGQPAEIKVCSYDNPGNCGPLGPSSTSGTAQAWGPTGYDVLTTYANDPQNAAGAVMNVTMIGYVPPLPPGHPFKVSPVYVVALGRVLVDVGLTYYDTLVADKVTNSWPIGMAVVTTSSLDGYTQISNYNPMTGNFSSVPSIPNCVDIDAPTVILAPPLRSSVTVTPDTTGQCGVDPTWPIPTYLPVWGNQTLVNATPDNTITSVLGWFNMTPGTYIATGVYGSAAQESNDGGAGNSPVTATALDEDSNTLTSYTTAPTAQPAPPREPGYAVAGCPANSWYVLCVPVPFGPVKIQVSATGSGGGTLENFTWADVAPGNYTAEIKGGVPLLQSVDTAPLVEVSSGGSVVKSGGYGALAFSNESVYGVVRVAGHPTEVPYGAVTITVDPSGNVPSELPPTSGAASTTTGQFSVPTTGGWVEVTASSPAFLTNSTWVDVPKITGRTANAGTIYLTPLATVEGQVVTGNGVGILQATAQYCSISQGTGSTCQDIGATGTTNSNGQYFGPIAGFPLPLGAYRLVFTATGYVSNWTWVNITTPGTLVNASTVSLPSETSASGSLPVHGAGAPLAPPVLAEWAIGNVVDNVTGLTVQGFSISWQTPGGTKTPVGSTDVNVLGDFNTSLPVGPLYLNFSANDYLPFSLFTNVTGFDLDAVDDLGTITMQPLTFYTGRVDIGPSNWTYLSSKDGLGPGDTSIFICTSSASTDCSPSPGTADLGGFYNTTGPFEPGQIPYVKIDPTVPAAVGTQADGFTLTAVGAGPTVSDGVDAAAAVGVTPIFGIVGTYVTDASTNNTLPVRYVQGRLVNGARSGNTSAMTVGAGGEMLAITTSTQGVTTINITTSGSPVLSYVQNWTANGTVGYGEVTFMPNISLTHFGWVSGIVESTTSPRAPVAWANATLTVDNVGTVGTANGAGYINFTASPGKGGRMFVGAPDYNTTLATNISISESVASPLSVLLSGSQGGIVPWGWVRGTVQDNAQQFGLDHAIVDVTGRYGTTGVSVETNVSGGYFTDAPIGPSAYVSVNETDYLGNETHVNIAAGQVAEAPLINLTGDGIAAGYVTAYPSGAPVPFANVTLCSPASPVCTNTVIANGSGYFWIAAPPGLDNLTVSLTDFVTTSGPVNITSDGWTWVGEVELDEYAYVSGSVVGLPSGIPVNGANVSICSILAFQEGILICPYATLTGAVGQFSLAVPAGDYILQVNATFYNTTFLPIQLSPGESVSMGLIQLELYGIAEGIVYGEDTLEPIPGTQITACPTWEVGNCTSVLADNTTGTYEFAGPPGPYAITASAPLHVNRGLVVQVVSDALVKVPTIYLPPLGAGVIYTVTGTVFAQSLLPGGAIVPFKGAVVADDVGDAAVSNASGGFVLHASWGDVLLTISAAGYQTVQIPELIRGNITGLAVTLYPETYNVSGYVTDGIDRAALVGVDLSLGGLVLATTSGTGSFLFPLPNGTYDVTVGFPSGSIEAATFAAIPFDFTVNGAALSRDLTMVPPTRVLDVTVDSIPSALPIPNATVIVAGQTYPEGVGLRVDGATDGLGQVGLSVYTGTFNVTASALGYLTESVAVPTRNATNGTIAVTISLAPLAPTSGAAGVGGGVSPALGAALGGGVVVLAAGVYLVTRRLSASGRTKPAAPTAPAATSTGGGPA